MLELAILGLLKEQDLHGYELKRRLSETLGVASGVSFGSLYPALARLEKNGAVRVVGLPAPSAPVPLTGSISGEIAAFRARKGAPRSGRARKVYAITDRGDALFAELLAADTQPGPDDRTFHLRLAFAGHLPREARLGLLERRRADLVERLAATRARIKARAERLDEYARSLIEHDQETAQHDLTWIERLIARERASAAGPPAAEAPETPPAELTETPAPTLEDSTP